MDNKVLRGEIKKYLRQIKRNLPFFHKRQKMELYKLQKGICEYLFLFPDAAMGDILQEFGTCDEVVASFIEESSLKEIKKYHNQRKVINIFLSMFVLFWFYEFIKNKSKSQSKSQRIFY